jgi:hypothetical protein
LVEVEVVDEIPPPNFNPPLNNLEELVLIQLRDLFSEPLSLFSDPYTMSNVSVSSSVAKPSIPSVSGTQGISVMSTLPSLSVTGPTPSMHFSTGPLSMGHCSCPRFHLSVYLEFMCPSHHFQC